MRDAPCRHVTLFDRRKGYGEPTLDRRRTYVDVMERVLGNDALARARQHNRFSRRIHVCGATAGTAITSIEVHLLDRYPDER
jgi:hypothetical protein